MLSRISPYFPGRAETGLFAAIGAAQGAAWFALFGGRPWPEGGDAPAMALAVALAAGPLAFYVVSTAERRWRDAAASAGLALLFAALASGWVGRGEGAGVPLPFPLALVLSATLLLPVYQVLRARRMGAAPAPTWFGTLADDVLIVAGGNCLAALFWVVLLLWASLFAIAGLPELRELLRERLTLFVLSGAAFGGGVALVRSQERHLAAARSFLLNPLSLLSPPFAVGAAGFLAVLPFATLQKVWATGHATPILLGLAGLGMLLVNAVVREAGADERPSRLLGASALVHIAAAPVLIALAGYSTWLRIDQYGLTSDRFHALFLIAMLGMGAVGYAIAAAPFGRPWPARIAALNLPLAAAAAILALLTLTPVLDPLRISAWHQVQRFADGRVAAADVDWGYLKWQLGPPGTAALERLASREDLPEREEVARQLSLLASSTSHADWRRRRDAQALEKSHAALSKVAEYALIRPAGATIPPEIVAAMFARQSELLTGCAKSPLRQCAVVVEDLDGDGTDDHVLVHRESQRLAFFLYRGAEGRSIRGAGGRATFELMAMMNVDSAADGEAAWRAIEAGDIGRLPPRQWDLRLGTLRVPVRPER